MMGMRSESNGDMESKMMEILDVGGMTILPVVTRDDVMELTIYASRFRHLRALISVPARHSLSSQLPPHRPDIGCQTSQCLPEVSIPHASTENSRSWRGHPSEARGASLWWHSTVNRTPHQALPLSRLSNSIQCLNKTRKEEEEGRLLRCRR